MNSGIDNRVEERCNFASTFWWAYVSGITSMVYRQRGESDLLHIWYLILSGEQKDRYLDGLKKLGIKDNEPPAIRAAKYHYFSNIIGGLNMQFIEESPKKVWLRYMGPNGTYPGVGMIAAPARQRRTVFSSWHARNGELMGCPRLGFVGTKGTSEGDPYDEGYFKEYDHDLSLEERIQFEVVQKTPEFSASLAPKLDPAIWPKERILKGMRNFAGDYLKKTVAVLQSMYGELETNAILRKSMRCIAVQFTYTFASNLGVNGTGVHDVAALFKGILDACFDIFEVKEIDEKTVMIIRPTFKPFPDDAPEDLRDAFFEFQIMAARMLNGHIKVTRDLQLKNGTYNEIWRIEDTGRWLW